MRSLILCAAFAAVLFAAGVAGTYKGSYSGSAASGDIQVALKQSRRRRMESGSDVFL